MERSSFSFLVLFWPLTFQSTASAVVGECPRRIKYVCGNDKVTYNNLCLLKRQAEALKSDPAGAAEETTKGLVMAYEGPCWGEDVPEHCDEVCSSLYNPICGSDGKTYSNFCWLRRASCGRGLKAHVSFTYDREC